VLFMEGYIVVNRKESRRAQALQMVVEGHLTLQEVVALLGVGYRQAKRLKADFLRDGLAGLVHGNRGKSPPNALSAVVRQKVLDLHAAKYSAFNDCHFTEMLAEKEDLCLSRETVRQLRRRNGIKPKRRRRPPRHRSRRPRKELPGMMVQWDGSPHRWFGEDSAPCCLMAAVDDATGILVGALFEPTESSAGYLRLLAMILNRHGIPQSFYHDRHGALVRNDAYWSLEEQLQGFQYPTHVGRVLQELGIEAIAANSPQAKGRVENRFQTLQDRLIAEMHLAGITTMEQANRWLAEEFIDRYNRRFGKPADKEGCAFIAISPQQIQHLVSFAYEATVAKDNAVRLGGLTIDIPPGKNRCSFAGKRALVRQHLDGSWSVWLDRQKIAEHCATDLREPVRTWKKRQNSSPSKIKEMLQVYIASKPAPPQKGTFSFCR
jgi:transposase